LKNLPRYGGIYTGTSASDAFWSAASNDLVGSLLISRPRAAAAAASTFCSHPHLDALQPSAPVASSQLDIFAFHRWTAWCTIVLTVSHPIVLLFLDKPHFRLFDILLPIQSPLQPFINLAGAAALYLLLLVFVTSLLRTRIGRPIWRSLHYLVFPAAVLLFIHSILTDPDLKDGHPDLLDGGKVFLEILAAVCFLAVAVRIRLRGRDYALLAAATKQLITAIQFDRPCILPASR